ncbi:MAG: U6 snRNA-associated Sm-like protein LSm6 [Desulfurococcales archaeon]|nr:U6 snRNA-associated Sm-like protein LSm6 [Desulfurococcales archaeon]
MATAEGKMVPPLRYLRSALGKPVYVKLKDGTEYVGILRVTDRTMNIVLGDTAELKNSGQAIAARYGDVFIRGSMILYISFDADKAAPAFTP